ncbi:chitin-binding protein [Pseudonocardiaceae bacterium YIM PH 21723]|nr:chitin-binding protein [Pseudonocardiaceae bacterium YIM PH 21723]
MTIGRKLAVTAAAAALTPALLVVSAGSASAHGYISSPLSRQAQCAQHLVKDCGDIQYEPQSVEGPKGLTSCNGGLSQFATLNDDNWGWQPQKVGSSTSFTWTITARHATTTWQYFVDGRKVTEINDGGKQPGASVTHSVNLAGLSGRHKMLAVWNIADTPMAFYNCVDLDINAAPAATAKAPAAAKKSFWSKVSDLF